LAYSEDEEDSIVQSQHSVEENLQTTQLPDSQEANSSSQAMLIEALKEKIKQQVISLPPLYMYSLTFLFQNYRKRHLLIYQNA